MFFDKNASNVFNSSTYIIASILKKHERRSKTQLIWGAIFVIFNGSGIVGGILDSSEGLREGIPVYVFFAALGALLLFLGLQKIKLLGSARRFDSIFMADNNGVVTCEEMTTQLGIPSHVIFSQLEKLFRLGMYQHCTLQSGGNPCVIINNATNSEVNIGFVQVQCANCGGISKIRAGSRGKCEYCSSEIIG